MADEHDPQQQPSFHWPPTAEELDTIQVVDMQGRPVRVGDTRHWRAGVAKATLAQIGVLAGSLAAIGIALTSMLAAPAQPVVKAANVEPKVAAPAPLSANAIASTAPTSGSQTPMFVPMVTLDIERPSAADIRGQQPQASTRDAREHAPRGADAAAAGVGGGAGVASASGAAALASARPTRVARTAERRFAKREAGKDPVSKFAVHTGLSVWKAMRAVGRTLRHQGDEEYFATRAAAVRRTARAVSLQAENAPSNR
jgi:hypothetical protein